MNLYYVSDPSNPDTDGDRLSDYDAAKQVKVAMASASDAKITKSMAEHINDIIPGEKIEFKPKPKASLMDDVAETSARAQRAVTPSLPKGSPITCYRDK